MRRHLLNTTAIVGLPDPPHPVTIANEALDGWDIKTADEILQSIQGALRQFAAYQRQADHYAGAVLTLRERYR